MHRMYIVQHTHNVCSTVYTECMQYTKITQKRWKKTCSRSDDNMVENIKMGNY